MVTAISDILSTPCQMDSAQYLKSVFVDIEADKANELVLKFTQSPINIDIKNKIEKQNKLDTWLALCRKIINPLISCQFDKRSDYDNLQVLPFCCKVESFSGQSYGLNVYKNDVRIMTIIYADVTRNNSAVLYSSDENTPIVTGSWLTDVKPAIKNINIIGLELVKQPTQSNASKKSMSVLSTYYRGNTITINDLVNYIDRIKAIYDKAPSI